MKRAKKKFYVGVKGRARVVFSSSQTPTEETHGAQFGAVIGPFRSLKGAQVMANLGGSHNPHLRSVADAERLAKKLKDIGMER